MPYAQSPTARIYYEARGDENGIPALFVEGFSVQMIGWREGFLDAFVKKGVRVILFDNRDVGLSQHFGGRDDFDGGYGLADMADDGFSVLDALGLPSAHVVGQSMGGIIAQLMATRAPERVRSLVLFYTAPGRGFLKARQGGPKTDGSDLYVERPRDEAIATLIAREKLSQSTAYPFDEEWVSEWATRSYDRAYAPSGIARQAAAIGRMGQNIGGLEGFDKPAVVIHGRDDALIDWQASLELARRLPKSELHLYAGLGHELAKPLWAEWAEIIRRSFRLAGEE
jgi:pimeloyl-ACP methyl ester carboxylesterase